MAIKISSDDFRLLVSILSMLPDFRSVQGRINFLIDVLAGSPRKEDILPLINFDGNARGVAVGIIERLNIFGQDEPGRETLGVLINKLIEYMGDGKDRNYLYDIIHKYPFNTLPVASSNGTIVWKGSETLDQIQEKIIGENTLRNIFILELALEAANSVVRIMTPNSLGTGFMITQNLLMTNNHVIHNADFAINSQYEFNFQLDRYLNPLQSVLVHAKKGGFFATNQQLDYTIIELDIKVSNFVPLIPKSKHVAPGDRVNIIQHPGGHYKKISIQNNFVQYADAVVVQYTTPTEPGSSGSPVFDDKFDVIAIHHSGGMLLEPNTQKTFLRNAGTSMIGVLDDIKKNHSEIYTQLN